MEEVKFNIDVDKCSIQYALGQRKIHHLVVDILIVYVPDKEKLCCRFLLKLSTIWCNSLQIPILELHSLCIAHCFLASFSPFLLST